MIEHDSGLPPMLTDVSHLAGHLRGHRDQLLVLDPAVADGALHADLVQHLGEQRHETVLGTATTVDTIVELADQISDRAHVTALGGGTVLDAAKLAMAVHADPAIARLLSAPQRSGLVVLPDQRRRDTTLVAVPTTLGTGAEVSSVACVDTSRGKRLVAGRHLLRPDVAVHDPRGLRGLPQHQLLEGVLEILFRVTSPYIGDSDGFGRQDRLVELTAARIVELGERCAVMRPGDDDLRELARLSAESHSALMHQDRPPYAVKGWAIANELAAQQQVRKMQAVSALLPALWHAIADGVGSLGSAHRLHQLWARVSELATTNARLSSHPGDGISDLIRSWGVASDLVLDAAAVQHVARQVLRSWGAGLPMLAEVQLAELEQLLGSLDERRPSTSLVV